MPEPKATIEVTASQLSAVAAELAMLAKRLELVADTAKGQQSNSLAMYNWPSVAPGLKLIGNFVAKAEESKRAADLGTPLPVGKLKARSTASKDDMRKKLASAKGKLDAHRKGSSKKPT